MTEVDRRPSIRRILIGLDASSQSLSALATAAQLAERLQVELVGVFVEDINLWRSAALPFVQEVNRLTGKIQSVDQEDIARQLELQARLAKQALETEAQKHVVKWSFRVVRGGVANELMAAMDDVDLMMLGTVGWAPRQRLGSTAQMVVSKARCMTLLHRPSLPHQSGICVLFDGSVQSELALNLGMQIGLGQVIDVMVLADSETEFLDREKRIQTIVTHLGRNVLVRRISNMSELILAQAKDLVIVPALESSSFLYILRTLNSSVLFVK